MANDTPSTELFTAEAPEIRPAGYWKRLGAVIIDGVILAICLWPIQIPFTLKMQTALANKDMGTYFQYLGILYSIQLPIYAAYYIFFYTRKGATPGKMVLGLTVVNAETGGRMGWGRTLARELVGKPVLWFSFFFLGLGFFLAVFRNDKRTLADFIAGTRVIDRKS